MKTLRYLGISLLVLLVDQGVKVWVKKTMYLGEEQPLLGDFLSLYFAENNGFAFGLTLTEIFAKLGIAFSPVLGKLILSVFSLIAITGLIFVLKKFSHHKSALPFFIAVIIGGAMGNIIDRIFYGAIFSSINLYEGGLLQGQVVDMFVLNFGEGSYSSPIFNIADVAISLGILIILIFQKRFLRKNDRLTSESTSESSPVIDPNGTSSTDLG